MVAILDSFHFKVTEEHQDSEPPAEQQEEEENDEDEKMVDETLASSLPQRIHSTILNTILPGLESCLTKEVAYLVFVQKNAVLTSGCLFNNTG